MEIISYISIELDIRLQLQHHRIFIYISPPYPHRQIHRHRQPSLIPPEFADKPQLAQPPQQAPRPSRPPPKCKPSARTASNHYTPDTSTPTPRKNPRPPYSQVRSNTNISSCPFTRTSEVVSIRLPSLTWLPCSACRVYVMARHVKTGQVTGTTPGSVSTTFVLEKEVQNTHTHPPTNGKAFADMENVK